MRIHRIGALAVPGSTGNNTHASVSIPADADALLLEFRVTAVGATPTITYQFQGSDDDGSLADAASDWYPLDVMPSNGATEVVNATQTSQGVFEYYLELVRRPTTKVRLVTSANTNVTYDAEARVAMAASN